MSKPDMVFDFMNLESSRGKKPKLNKQINNCKSKYSTQRKIHQTHLLGSKEGDLVGFGGQGNISLKT